MGSSGEGFAHAPSCPYTLPPGPVHQVPQCDLDWESAMPGMWAYMRPSSGTRRGGSVTPRLWSRQAGGYWGWQTEPDWTAGHFSTARLTPLMSAHRRLPTVGAFLHPRLSRITPTDHPCLKKCPARFKFSQECSPSERPPAHLDPSQPGNPDMIVVSMCFLVCGLSLGTAESLCKLIPKSQYHLKKFTLAPSGMKSINESEINLQGYGLTGSSRFLLAWTTASAFHVWHTHAHKDNNWLNRGWWKISFSKSKVLSSAFSP